MSGGNHVHVNYFPSEHDHPTGSIGRNNVALRFESMGTFQDLTLQFSHPDEDALAVRYLRELAAAATDLADQVQKGMEDATAEAVLQS